MDREEYRPHFEMLELTIEASPADVNKAYSILRDIYSKDTLATMSLPDEISSGQTEEVLQQIEDSYQALAGMFGEEQQQVATFVEQLVCDMTEFNGAVLKEIRHKLEVSLDDMAMATRVLRKHLVNIEEDNFGELPVAVYTRGFVVNYAKFLSLDAEIVAKSYMDNFKKFHEEGSK